MLCGNYCYIFIENFPQKFSPCIISRFDVCTSFHHPCFLTAHFLAGFAVFCSLKSLSSQKMYITEPQPDLLNLCFIVFFSKILKLVFFFKDRFDVSWLDDSPFFPFFRVIWFNDCMYASGVTLSKLRTELSLLSTNLFPHVD